MQTPELYQTVYEKLKESNDRTLTEALTKAALHNKKFPHSMKMDTLQEAWLKYKQHENLRGKFVTTIFRHIRDDGMAVFKKALETDSPEKLDRELIEFLQSTLGISGTPQPLIEATIRNGKVLWRTIDPLTGKSLEDPASRSKTGLEFKYDKTTCFRMTPAEFNRFKKAKKFFGTNVIDRKSFITEFQHHYMHETIHHFLKEDYIGNIWDELKSTGILDGGNQLAGSISLLSGRLSKLQSFDTTSNSLLSKVFSTLENLNGAVLTVPKMLNNTPTLVNLGQARRVLRDGLKTGALFSVTSQEPRPFLFWKKTLWVNLPETDQTMIQQVKTVVAKK